jgi:hypothetical protein
MLTWSGFFDSADAVNNVAHYDATKKADEKFTFPVEFVSYDAQRKYITFKAPIPADQVAKIQSLKPGEWVTATSPHGKASGMQPIVKIRPYVSSSKDSN